MYAFVTQYCDEDADRPIHLYMDDEDDGGEVSRSLAEQLAPLFPNDRLLAVCEEDPQSLHGANGELSGWNGLATVVTNSGLYHVKSNSSGAYELDGKTAYLSWAKLFGDCKANLMIQIATQRQHRHIDRKREARGKTNDMLVITSGGSSLGCGRETRVGERHHERTHRITDGHLS